MAKERKKLKSEDLLVSMMYIFWPTHAVCVDMCVPFLNSAPLLPGRTSSLRIRAHTNGLTLT